MDNNLENSMLGRASRLRQPSQISSPGNALVEMSASAENARAAGTMRPPAERANLKHRSTALPEPASKRKTLVERAGEVPRTASFATPLPKPMHAPAKPTPISTPRSTQSRPASALGSYKPINSTRQTRSSVQTSVPATRPASSLDTNSTVTDRPAIGKRKAWDTKGRLEDVEYLYSQLTEKMNGTLTERRGLEESIDLYQARINDLEAARTQLTISNGTLQTELDGVKARLTTTMTNSDDEMRKHRLELDDLERRHRDQLDGLKREAKEVTDQQSKKHVDELHEVKRRYEGEVENERSRRLKQVQELATQAALDSQKAQLDCEMKDRELRALTNELEQLKGELASERALKRHLQDNLAQTTSNVMTLESSFRASKSKIEDLDADRETQARNIADLQHQLQHTLRESHEMNEKLRSEESIRRKLHNQIQELKGNIRVFCRVRPSIETEPPEESAKITFPDSDREYKEIEIQGPEEKSSLGNVSVRRNAFNFDRVFAPRSTNDEIFDEISQLVQSALDGYNVCIFCYGQTGSGKTYTMSSDDGMIPRALHQIYQTAQTLTEKGWRYTMEGSFVEVYNENLNDLLGRAEDFDKKKHEIRHDMQRCKTHVADLTTVLLDSPAKVESILRQASANRSVAATKANERSSRSHSVFILRMTGENDITGERSEGTLNLVDLAGSERLSQSGSTGDRLKETQNINRSLSCLGDVIGALGQGKEGGHVPYRNSKLTYLLQFSLGGNSKTLMFVMISPLHAHLSETLTSLKFATKVHNTHIGTARRQARIKDS
ncbi:MAG: kinesin-like nuclear fusion protein [Peltula sp. TS41687]|nr:MAG: kinesin-like nuclear fusion protein [Peltula sp. TS41687]